MITAKRTNLSVTPRDIRFEPAQHYVRHWLGGDPVGTAVMNALSLTFPDGERLFVDAVRHYRERLPAALQDDTRRFIAQEALHSREHQALNDLVDPAIYPVAEILAKIRARIAAARARGPFGMLVSTIALEHFTAMMAEVHMEARDRLYAAAEPRIEQLWRWHALEETEHKAVAYDVFMEITRHWSPLRRYWLRVWTMALITVNFTHNISRHAARLLEAEGYGQRTARAAVSRYLWLSPGIFRLGWRTYIAWYRPGFHPWQIGSRPEVISWRDEFDAIAKSSSL
jgi:predicted metal-dependent hydrolase